MTRERNATLIPVEAKIQSLDVCHQPEVLLELEWSCPMSSGDIVSLFIGNGTTPQIALRSPRLPTDRFSMKGMPKNC